jgi:hypothetical protein
MESISETPTPKQQARLHEVADLMLEIYNTLARMLYLEPEWIHPGPHDLTPLMPLYECLHLDPSIIYLYHILPYVKGPDWPMDFFMGNSFADFRDPHQVRQGRDPFYTEDKPEEMMRPWMTPLSMLGNHQCVLLYDARRNVVGIYDHETGSSHDPSLGVIQKWNDRKEKVYFIRKDGVETPCDALQAEKYMKEEEVDYKEEEGGDEEQEDRSGNGDTNIWDDMDARPAGRVLRDIVRWYHELLMTPGGGDHAGQKWYEELVRPLYRKHGWPGEDFDADGFLVDQVRAVAAERAKDRAEKPFEELKNLKYSLKECEEKTALAMPQWQEKIAQARNPDEEWLVRWEMWFDDLTARGLQRSLERAEDSIGLGGESQMHKDLPLWELREVQVEFQSKKRRLEALEQELSGSSQEQERIRRAEKETAISERAYLASLADAERLCPGRPPFPLDPCEVYRARIGRWATAIENSEQDAADIRQWMKQLPEGADGARKLAEERLDYLGGCIEGCKKQWQRYVEAMEKLAQKSRAEKAVSRIG